MLDSGRMLGFLMLAGTIFLWVASSVTVQMIFEGGVHFEKPVFVTLFNSASSVSLLLPRLARPLVKSLPICSRACQPLQGCSPEDKTPLSCVVHLSATLGLLWLCAQWIFNWSLLHTSVATNTVLSSTTSVFTFFFSLVICRDPFKWCSFGAALFSFLGCVLVSSEKPSNIEATAVTSSAFGDILTLTSAAMFSLVSVMLRKLAPSEFDLSFFMGMNGVFAIAMSPMVLYAAHHSGVENFRPPTGNVLMALSLNAVLGCTCANYLYTSALLLLSPLVTTVCMSLTIPVSALTDEVFLRQHAFSAEWLLGATLVASGVIFAAFDMETAPTSGDKNKGEWAEAAEMESLLDSQSGGEMEDEAPSQRSFARHKSL